MKNMEITHGKKFITIVLTMFVYICLTLVGNGLFKILSPLELILIGLILMIFSLWVGKNLSNLLYSNINHFHRIESNKKIKQFIDYSTHENVLYRPYFRDLDVPIFDSDNKKCGSQSMISYLHDKNKEFNNK